MQIQPFSCLRPVPERIGDALSKGIGAAEDRSLFTLDASRALYLVRRRAASGETFDGLVCCCSVDELAGLAVRGDEGSKGTREISDGTSPTARTRDDLDGNDPASRLQVTPVMLAYQGNVALRIIFDAAMTATPLYDLQGPDGSRLAAWRVSRPEAVDALAATFEAIGAVRLAGEHDLALAEDELAHANDLRSRRDVVTGREPFNVALSLLVADDQVAVAQRFEDAVPEGLLMHYRA